MRVLLVHNRYRSTSPSGEDRVVDQEHAALEGAGHVVGRFERSSDEIAGFSLGRKVRLPVDAVRSRSAARDLATTISSFEPDVVHLHNLFPLVSPSALGVCARHGVPCVVTVHNYLPICVSGYLHRDGQACTECVGRTVPSPGVRHGCYHSSAAASAVMALSTVANRDAWRTVPSAYLFLSEAQRALFAPLQLPSWRCFVKGNLVPPTVRRTSPEDLVVFVGRLAEVKGLRVLMRAWDAYLAADADPNLRLAVAGAGPLEGELRTWASTRPSVDVHGLLDQEACAGLVARATTVVAPSEWREPFGLVVAEAMAAGVGPVASAHGAFPELIEDGVDGLLFPPGDHVALADRFRLLERSPRLVASLGDAARRSYERRFAPAGVVSQLEAVYRFAVDHPSRPASRSTRAKDDRRAEAPADPSDRAPPAQRRVPGPPAPPRDGTVPPRRRGRTRPHSRVHDLATVRHDFSWFAVVRARKRFLHAPPLPWVPGRGRSLGRGYLGRGPLLMTARRDQ